MIFKKKYIYENVQVEGIEGTRDKIVPGNTDSVCETWYKQRAKVKEIVLLDLCGDVLWTTCIYLCFMASSNSRLFCMFGRQFFSSIFGIILSCQITKPTHNFTDVANVVGILIGVGGKQFIPKM